MGSGAERSVANCAPLIPRLESRRLPIQPDHGALDMELRCGQPLAVHFERGPLLFVSLSDLFDEMHDACLVAAVLHATMPCFIAVRCITFLSFQILEVSWPLWRPAAVGVVPTAASFAARVCVSPNGPGPIELTVDTANCNHHLFS